MAAGGAMVFLDTPLCVSQVAPVFGTLICLVRSPCLIGLECGEKPFSNRPNQGFEKNL